jgi:hypothetical protein
MNGLVDSSQAVNYVDHERLGGLHFCDLPGLGSRPAAF